MKMKYVSYCLKSTDYKFLQSYNSPAFNLTKLNGCKLNGCKLDSMRQEIQKKVCRSVCQSQNVCPIKNLKGKNIFIY